MTYQAQKKNLKILVGGSISAVSLNKYYTHVLHIYFIQHMKLGAISL